MKGVVFLGDRTLEIRDYSEPLPGPGEVIIKTKVSAICGSDLHIYRKSVDAYEFPDAIKGHELSGIVHKVGSGVKTVKPGDRVCAYHYNSCGRCRNCLEGNAQFCNEKKALGWHINGSDAEYVMLNEVCCMPLPDELSFINGTFISCNAGTSYSALRKLNITVTDTVAVFGLGPVGISGVMLAKAMGAKVIGVDMNETRLKLAKKLGADEVVNCSSENTVDALRNLTNGVGPNKLLETSGSKIAQRDTVHAASLHGKIAYVGINDDFGPVYDHQISFFDIVHKEIELYGSFVMPKHYYYDLVELIVNKNIDFSPMVTHSFSLDNAKEAFELFDKGDTGKVIFQFD